MARMKTTAFGIRACDLVPDHHRMLLGLHDAAARAWASWRFRFRSARTSRTRRKTSTGNRNATTACRSWVRSRRAVPPVALDPPSDDEVMRALEKVQPVEGGVPLLWERNRNNVRIVKDKIADYVDPPRVYPLVGPAQQHHAHYKCTVYYEDVRRIGWPVPHTLRDEEAEEVIYIDHNHLHMVGNVDTGLRREVLDASIVGERVDKRQGDWRATETRRMRSSQSPCLLVSLSPCLVSERARSCMAHCRQSSPQRQPAHRSRRAACSTCCWPAGRS